ncbi:hypothetical protein JOD43_000267 [Pullulanibacillus pueri]|uniref:Coat protein n=1 Tax=Pullulanibacillus pueri TaxID=1437324 RepID=A0A8J3EKD1_9BACL|nr:YlbD family protein [Pullulanibacillus pueri]MBM7680108.1 hypothetical protein [Pullulanibacillus pueri]GGH74398.1 hypothetical protein GCM10007096_02590 [Pullulanibacillus pueri]
MANKKSESIEEFKVFVKKHPELVKGIKKEGKSWKDIFDEWLLFGEDHEIWEQYGIKRDEPKKKPKGAAELMRVFDFIGNLDAKEMQERLDQVNGVLTNIQDLIVQFQPESSPSPQQNYPLNQWPTGNGGSPQQAPPYFRRD